MSQAATTPYPSQIGDAEITLSPSARTKMTALLADADDDILAVRLFVSGEGCGGMSYGMTYAEAINDYDSILPGKDFTVVIDPIALSFIQGCQIDFDNGKFAFKNVFQSVGGSGSCGGCGGSGF